MDSMHLLSPDKLILVAVSGGVDSMALMYVLNEICKGQIRILHFNHGTRAENALEERLVRTHCQYLGLAVDVIQFDLLLDQKNFEAMARHSRLEIYREYIKKNYWVYTAHHLDDSFEWSMSQSLKQSSLESTLGIPVFNKGLVRPFLCVSKNQIQKYAKCLGLSWALDSSNNDSRFERNFLRKEITATLYKRYPQYLRHYVARQTELALKLGKHRSLLQKNSQAKPGLLEKREVSGAIILKSLDFSFYKERIKKRIHFLSKTHRGEIDREVDKLILAHKKMKENEKELKMKGPFSFSGGVKIFILNDYLLMTNDQGLNFYQRCDERIKDTLEKSLKSTQITFGEVSSPKKVFFPYLVLLNTEEKKKTCKLIHPLLPKTTEWLKRNSVPYSFYPLLSKKNRQKLSHSAVILDSSILGL